MSERVRVVVRVRPFIASDPEDADLAVVVIDPTHVSVGGSRVFAVDRIYQMENSTSDIFVDSVQKIVDDFLSGFHATVMACGQTGTGKTFTMSGLMSLILRYIVEEGFHGATHELSFQFIEVYGDALRDLLSEDPTSEGNDIQLYDSGVPNEIGGRDCVVVGARRATAENLKGIESIIQYATQMRATAATNIHEHSSRSHSIFTIYNHQKGGNKLHLVDLAGSERNKKTLNVGQRFKESIAINSGLLALGNVIRALVRNSHQNNNNGGDVESIRHVPYRSSKLTRLLQNALGGTGKTLFLGCIAPDSYNQDETLRTLQYCALAVRVLNTPIQNYKELHDAQMLPFRRPKHSTNRPSAAERRSEGEGTQGTAVNHEEKTIEFSFGSDKVDIHTELDMYKNYCLEQDAMIESLQQQLKVAEDRSRVFEDELRNDQVILTRQIVEMERLVSENRGLRQRLVALTNVQSHPSEKGSVDKAKGSTHSQNIRAHPLQGRSNAEADGKPERGSFEKQTTPRSGPTVLSPVHSAYDANYRPYGTTSTANSSLSPQLSHPPNNGALSRDEQLFSLTKEALYYQTNNSELRNQLANVMLKLESQQRESALLRLELQELHGLLNTKK